MSKTKESKETIVCSVSDQLLHKLARYEIREGLKQTHVYERALTSFIEWYEQQTSETLKHWRVLASAQGGKPYRGRVLTSQKTRLADIAEELKHSTMDVCYTALTMLMEQEEVEKTHLINCFLDHSLYERCEQRVHQGYEDRSAFVEEACTQFMAWYDGSTRPKSYVIPTSSYTGRSYQAYVSTQVYERLGELATQHTLSPVDVYHEVLVRHDQGEDTTPTVVVTAMLPKNTAKHVQSYIQDCQMTEGTFIEDAIGAFLKAHPASSLSDDWSPTPASVDGEPFRGHVSSKLAEKLHKLPYPRLDLYAHAVRYYAHKRNIHAAPYLFEAEEESTTATHGMAKIKLLPEQEKLIRLLIVFKDMRTINEFCHEASKWWLARRRKMERGEEEYFSRLSPSDEDDEDAFVDVHLTIPYAIHSALQSFAQEDSQSMRTVYYNAIIRYLDHISDLEDLNRFIDKIK